MSETTRSRVWLWVLIGGGAFFLFVLAVFTLVFLAFRASGGEQAGLFGDKIGVVDLDGACMCIELTRQCCRCDTSPDGVSSTGWLAVSADATPTRTRKHGDTMK